MPVPTWQHHTWILKALGWTVYILVNIISTSVTQLLGVFHALVWSRNTLWAHTCLSVCRVFYNGGTQPAWLGVIVPTGILNLHDWGVESFLWAYLTCMTGGDCIGVLSLHGQRSLFLWGVRTYILHDWGGGGGGTIITMGIHNQNDLGTLILWG
jgi:hypothetical protein